MANLSLSSRLAAVNESATLALNARAKQMAAEGKTIYNLTTGELDTDTPDYIQEAVSKVLAQNKYTPVAGLQALRQQIADHNSAFYDLDFKAENVVVTGGSKPGLYAAFMALLDPDDEVIVPVPAWVSHISLVELAGGKAVEVPLTENYDLNPEAVLAAITPKTKMILLNSPHNPTGAVFSEPAIKRLADKIKGSNITILADDIYSKLIFNSDYYAVPKAGFDNVIIINGFSKSQALTGWRIGYMLAPEPIAKAATSLLSHITGNASVISQQAAIAAMERHDQPPQTTLDDLKRKKQLVSDGLSKAGIKHNEPSGAFYIFLDVRGLANSSAEWCEKLLTETGVALVPGEAFNAPGFVRLTFVADDYTLKGALEQIEQFVKVNA